MKFELAHDHLAKAIYDAVSIEQQQEKHAYTLIDMRYQNYQLHKELLLGEEELQVIQPFLEELELDEPKKAFIEKSQQKLAGGKRKKRARNYTIIAIATTFLFLPMAIWGLKSAFDAKHAKVTAEKEAIQTNKALAKAEEENNSLRRVITGDSMPRVMNMKDLQSDDFETIRNAEETYATMHLSGRVLDRAGRPISNANVQLMGAILKTNKRGEFDCYFVMPPLLRSQNAFYLDVEKSGFQPLREKVKPDAEVELKLTLD